jgi:hypothetical protein
MALEENVLDERQQKYLDWLTTPKNIREPSSKEKYAAENSVNITTLRRWEKKDVFRRAWEKQADDIVGSPERTQSLLDELFSRGMQGDVQAAKLYFTVTGKMKPAEMTITTKSSAAELTDQELEALIAQTAQEERHARNGASYE